MEVNERQLKILNYLLSSTSYVTADELAVHLGVSARTVYRDISAINSVTSVVINTPGRGVKLDYQAFTSEAERLTRGKGGRGLSIQGRRRAMLMLLLVSAPHPRSVIEFSEIFHVGTSSIQNDLAHVAQLAKERDLTLSATNKGTTLVGTEADIREALADCVIPLIVHENVTHVETGKELAFLRSQGVFQEKDLDAVAGALAAMEETHFLYLENPYYINMLTHLLIMVERIRLARSHHVPVDSLFDKQRPAPPMEDPAFAAAAVDLLHRLEEALDLHIPDRDSNYIYAFLRGSDSRPEGPFDSGLASGPIGSADDGLIFTAELIDRVSVNLGINLRDDKKLLEKLALHVKPMLFRTAHGVEIRNPVLEDIRNQFPNVLQSVTTSLAELEDDRGLTRSSSSEAGYLVLYFQQAIERAQQQLRIIIVCSTGRGTALFLRGRIERRFPEWRIVDLFGVRDLEKIIARITSTDDIDLVISTIPLEGLPVPIATVSSLLTDRDAELLIQSAEKAGWTTS